MLTTLSVIVSLLLMILIVFPVGLFVFMGFTFGCAGLSNAMDYENKFLVKIQIAVVCIVTIVIFLILLCLEILLGYNIYNAFTTGEWIFFL